MARTIVGLGDAKAVKRYSGMLAVDVARQNPWNRKYIGKGEEAQAPIVQLDELQSDAGEQITYDLSVQLRQKPIEGDNKQRGTEEGLRFYSDAVYIDQMRGGVNGGGRMTRKRTLHSMRNVAKARMAEWWARAFSECIFMYLSGARGVNDDFVYDVDWSGRANNSLSAPDAYHIRYAGGKAKNSLTTGDKMALSEIDAVLTAVKLMGGGTKGIPKLQPILINGDKHFVCMMNPQQAQDLRTNTGTGQWLDLQKAAVTAQGKDNPIFKGGLGMYNNVVLQEEEGIIRFGDYGNPATVAAARALFLGRQAGAVAFGSKGGVGLRFDWYEGTEDNDNEIIISTSCIWGFKKCTFNGLDFGAYAIDTAATAPTA